MSRFSIKYPYFIIVCCLVACIIGAAALMRMPVDLFPKIRIPVVVVATFYSGMPAEQIETSITGRFERFFTLASNIDHIESKSLPGVSLIKIYFQPGTGSDSAVTSISNLAMANLRRLPAGTLPPVVLKFDASSMPVCLITLKAQGFGETRLRDLGQFAVRNQIASVPGASVPQPFGGKYRQIMVYVDPIKLEATKLSVMDVVRSINDANLILPSGNVKIGPLDYSLFTNSQLNSIKEINAIPLKTIGNSSITVGDIGFAKDGAQIQTSIVRVDGQRSVYLPILKQGGDSNTIAIVEEVKKTIHNLTDIPKELIAQVAFDQSIFVKQAIENLIHEGLIGLVLTGLMILIFLGSVRATLGVFFSIPLSVMTTFAILSLGDNSINSMILGGLALAFSRLIDNSVVVLENIFRHLEMGESPEVAAEFGGREVALPVLAATLAAAIVFFPVIFLYGVSKYLFTALALSTVISLFISYVVAMTVVPLFCAKYIRISHDKIIQTSQAGSTLRSKPLNKRFNDWFNKKFQGLLSFYDRMINKALGSPKLVLRSFWILFIATMFLIPVLKFSYFPRTDPGQFMINIKAASGTRIENTEKQIAKIEEIIKKIVPEDERNIIVSNIGVTPGFSSIYTSNNASNTAFVQVSLKENHQTGSYEYMKRVRRALQNELPELTTYFQSGGLTDAVLNLGLPAPINIQIAGSNLETSYKLARDLAFKIGRLSETSDIFIPQDIDAPTLKIDVDRLHASELGLSQKEIVGNVITALASNQMIAPSYWVDPKNGNDYLLTVQYPEGRIKSLNDLKSIPIRGLNSKNSVRLDAVTDIRNISSPTVINHYQLKRVIDIFVATKTEDLSHIYSEIKKIITDTKLPNNISINIHGAVEAMHSSLKTFGFGLILACVLIYLILVAQFKSFIDPVIILLAVPPGLIGTILILLITKTTLNVMSLMGVVMLIGICVSNSILIVEFTHHLQKDGMALKEAVATACRVRLRPVLMTSLATIIGLIPMALALGTGSEAYAPLARVIIGGLICSVIFTIFIVPLTYFLIYEKRSQPAN